MTDKFLNEQEECYKRLENVLSEEQVDAIIRYVEHVDRWTCEWVEEQDTKVGESMMSEMRQHRHLSDGSVVKHV